MESHAVFRQKSRSRSRRQRPSNLFFARDFSYYAKHYIRRRKKLSLLAFKSWRWTASKRRAALPAMPPSRRRRGAPISLDTTRRSDMLFSSTVAVAPISACEDARLFDDAISRRAHIVQPFAFAVYDDEAERHAARSRAGRDR